ncbi:MAG: DUF362 domain-containing protein [Nanoarchaeota archaeon]
MTKVVSIKFKSYQESVPKLLELVKIENEIKKYDSIVLKPCLNYSKTNNTSLEFVEAVLSFVKSQANQGTKIFIAEGSEGGETHDLFTELNYKRLAEKYNVSLVDLNNTEFTEIKSKNFMSSEAIIYPKILLDSMVISLPKLSEDVETQISGSIANMLGAYPASYYKGWFSRVKNKIRKEPIKYAIHDIIRCKIPEVAIIDASEQGRIFVGSPLEADKQVANLLKGSWKSIEHLQLVEESNNRELEMDSKRQHRQQELELKASIK